MSERAVYQIRRGADYSFLIASEDGDDITGYTISAKVKKLPGGRNSYNPSSTIEATYTSASYGGGTLSDGTVVGPGWYLNLSDTQTLALSPGVYMSDALIVNGSADYITLPWLLEVVDTVSHA